MKKDTRDLLLKQYKILCNFNINHDQQFWTQYSIFLAANAIILIGFFQNIKSGYCTIFSITGIIISIIWFLTTNRNTFIRDFRVEKAQFIENQLYNNLKIYKIFNNTLNKYLRIPEEKRKKEKSYKYNKTDYNILEKLIKKQQK